MARVNIEPDEADVGGFYKLLTAVVVPRPIAWVSTLSPDGVANLAPHSFFSVAAINPPIVQFTSIGRKDSLNNAEASGEFVVNLAPSWLFEEINATATSFPPSVSEFEAVGVEAEPSTHVAPPRVARSPVALECVLHDTSTVGVSTVVLGRVVNAAIDEQAIEDGHPLIERLAPLARLGRNEWSEIGTLREIARIPYDEWPGHYDGA